jgi:hypothetical protein
MAQLSVIQPEGQRKRWLAAVFPCLEEWVWSTGATLSASNLVPELVPAAHRDVHRLKEKALRFRGLFL